MAHARANGDKGLLNDRYGMGLLGEVKGEFVILDNVIYMLGCLQTKQSLFKFDMFQTFRKAGCPVAVMLLPKCQVKCVCVQEPPSFWVVATHLFDSEASRKPGILDIEFFFIEVFF